MQAAALDALFASLAPETLTVPDPEFATSPVMFAETPLGADPTAVAGQSVA